MALTIHPHKGYLNTNFHIHYSGNGDLRYNVFDPNDSSQIVATGAVSPNIPYKLNFPTAGEYEIHFENGHKISIDVEDAYKFGGSRLKRAFVFDTCPWLFVIMHDRTYFYNRDNKIAYVEPISPDVIVEVNSEFVIFENHGQQERTLYSLSAQKAILWVSDIVIHNEKVLIWEETANDEKILNFYSLAEQRCLTKQKVEKYVVDEKNSRLLFLKNNKLESIALNEDFSQEVLLDSHKGEIVAIYAPSLAICYTEKYSIKKLYLYNLYTQEQIKEIILEGHLAKVGSNNIINTYERETAIRDLNLVSNGLPDAELSALYHEFNFFLTEWEIFYTEKIINLKKSGIYDNVTREESCVLHSCIKQRSFSLKHELDTSIIIDDTICLYNDNECFVCNKSYSKGAYEDNCSIYLNGLKVYLYKDSALFTLSRNGFWDHKREGNFGFSEFDKFGVIEDKATHIYQTIGGCKVGKKVGVYNPNNELGLGEPRMYTREYYIYSNARKIKNNGVKPPQYISAKVQYGITVNDTGVFLGVINNGHFEDCEILADIYDTSVYRNVLLSEDGKRIMHRDGDSSVIIDLSTGMTEKYDNLSFIKHINGIRPLFDTPSSLQPRLINPVTKQPIDCRVMSKYQFISPDGVFYADTRLSEYEEYYSLETNNIISQEEYKKLQSSFEYPWQQDQDSAEWQNVIARRRNYILDNFDYINAKYPRLINNDRSGKHWEKILLDVDNRYGAKNFLEYFIGCRGVAYIRLSSDNSEYARIELGEPLTFINYVSFSYDNRYLALAGYRGERYSKNKGLFIIYDLNNKETILFQNTRRAVWLTAFSIKNSLASYTSNPFTFFAKESVAYQCDRFEDRLIINRNFLTFSPDGNMFALSDQGYISKYDQDGNEQSKWGHQPSSLVEIRALDKSDQVIVSFHDLSDFGIDDVATSKESVASVSFSNDNKKLMMVGKDGVVIVRNLHLDEYATE